MAISLGGKATQDKLLNEAVSDIANAVLKNIRWRIDQRVRDQYQGERTVDARYDPDNSKKLACVVLRVTLLHTATGERISVNQNLPIAADGKVIAAGLVRSAVISDLTAKLVLAINDHQRQRPWVSKPLPSPRFGDHEEITLPHTPVTIQGSWGTDMTPPCFVPSPPKKARKVCALCGPELDIYPPWELECSHD